MLKKAALKFDPKKDKIQQMKAVTKELKKKHKAALATVNLGESPPRDKLQKQVTSSIV